MAYNVFGHLVKCTTYANWATAKAAGNLAFGEFNDAPNAAQNGKWIYANGVEYHVADFGELETLKERVNAFDIVTNATNNSIQLVGKDSSGNAKVYGEVTLASTDYIDLGIAADGSINATLKDSQLAKGVISTSDVKLATDGYVNDVVKAVADAAIIDVSVTANVYNGTATIKIESTAGDGTSIVDSYTITGDDYVKIAGATDAIEIDTQVTNSSLDIENASTSTKKLTTDIAVKEYVEAKVAILEKVIKLKGNVDSSTSLAAARANAEKGDAYVVTANFEADNKIFESGDLVIMSSVGTSSSPATYFVVERSLDGAVTSADTLTENKIILGNGRQSVKTSTYGVGDETSTGFGNASTLATEAGTKGYVDGTIASTGISAAVTAGAEYIDASVDATDNKKINIAVDVAENISTAVAGQLADAKQVYDTILASGGRLDSVIDTNAAKIRLTSAAAASGSEGDLGNVSIYGENYVKIGGSANNVSIYADTATLADISNGTKVNGLALTKDVYDAIVEVEYVTASSFNKISDILGISKNPFDTSAGFKAAFGNNATFTSATIDLSTDLTSLKNGLDAKISAAIDASIKLLDATDSSVAGQVVVKVDETDGIVNTTKAGIIVNGQTATSDALGNITVTISGVDASVAGTSVHAEKSIAEAIEDLSTAIDAGSSAIKTITGEAALAPATGTTANDDYVAVSASAPDANGNVTIDSSVLIANQPTVLVGTAATATGLATDAYVKDSIVNALAWEIL